MNEINWFEVWISKSLVEMVFPLILVAVILLVAIIGSIPRLIKRKLCKHHTVRETMACDAVCLKCGKNLGFIQRWRDENRGKDGFREV